MKLKALVAALALISGAAHAGYVTFTDNSARGELFFTLTAPTASAFFDLGISADKFSFANVGGAVCTAGAACVVDKQITWNFTTGTVTSTGAADLSAVVAGVSGDWAAAWGAYSANLSSSVFAVAAGDREGTNVIQQKYLSTSASPANIVANTTNNNLLNFNTMNNWHNGQQLTGGGNHGSVANGANVINDTSSVLYNGATGSMKTNWNDKAVFASVGAVGSELAFYGLDGKAGGSTTRVNVTNYYGKFAINGDTLTYTTLAVPEASTYAMLLAGLGLMGLMARRRVK